MKKKSSVLPKQYVIDIEETKRETNWQYASEGRMDAATLQRTIELIYSRCCRLLGNPEQAQDALQEVFTRFFETSRKQTIQQPLHFLYRLSTNYCIDLLRTKGRTVSLTMQIIEKTTNPFPHQGEEHSLIRKLTQKFSKDDVELMTYRYVDQMTYKEIAELYGMSDRGIQKKIKRTEMTMKKYLVG